MKIAAAHAIANLAKEDVPDEVVAAMGVKDHTMVENTLFLLHSIQD